MGVDMLTFAMPLLLLVLGPAFVYSAWRSARAREGTCGGGSGAYTTVINWLGVLVGLAATLWAVWRLWHIVGETGQW
jgi:hypothetical protein